MISYKDIGERVRALRFAQGLTQTQFAKILKTSQTAVSDMELGNRGLTVQQVVKLARVLKVTPNDILGEGRRARPRTNGRPKSSRILRRLSRIEKLPEQQQQAILKLLDGIIEAHTKAS